MSKHLVTLSEDFVREGVTPECSCGWSGGTYSGNLEAAAAAQDHMEEVEKLVDERETS